MNKVIKGVKWLFSTLVKYILLYASMLVPKKRTNMVFGSWFGAKYADNSRYLYEYVVEKRKDISAVWLTESAEVYESLRQKNYPVRMSNTWGSLMTVLRARYIFTVTGKRDIGSRDCNFIGNAFHINLWHGIPLKKIMYDDDFANRTSLKNKISKALERFPLRRYFVVSTSDTMSKIYESAFRTDKKHILQLGQPRNDYFFIDHNNPHREKYEGKKIILYMPTHRNEGKTEMDLNILLDVDRLNNMCEKYGYIFLIKKHFYHKDDAPLSKEYSAVFDITAEYVEAQQLLDSADILITDYSSCYIDYLLLDRPIIFYNYDMENYQKNDRQLYFEYNDATPGNKCTTFEDLYGELEKIIQGADEFASNRKETCAMFYAEDNQGSVSEKIIKSIEQL